MGKPGEEDGLASSSYVLVTGIRHTFCVQSAKFLSSNLSRDIPYCLLEEQQTRKTKNLVRVKPRMGANPIEATNGRFV